MKKILLLSAASAAICLSALAQDAQVPPYGEPLIIQGAELTAISADGTYVVGISPFDYGAIRYNRLTGQLDIFSEEGRAFSPGFGTCVSNNGILVASTTESEDDASYFENGQWHQLAVMHDIAGLINTAHGITPDGSRICGQVGSGAFSIDETNIMQKPAYWQRNAANNGYDSYTLLPHPNDDFFGTTPQFITAVQISNDGKLIAGQIMCGSGFYTEPIYYMQAEDGTWSYVTPLRKYLQDKLAELPQDPGEAPETPDATKYMTAEELAAYQAEYDYYNNYGKLMPTMTDFMSPEEKEAYDAAWAAYEAGEGEYPIIEEFMTSEEERAYNNTLDKYYENWPQYPLYKTFMSEDEKAKYDEDMEAYDALYDEWCEKNEAFEIALANAGKDIPNFEFNAVCLSGNGKWLVYTASGLDTDTFQEFFIPWAFDLETGEYCSIEDEKQLYPSFVANDGTIMAASPASPYAARQTFVIENRSANEIKPLEDWIKPRNQELYNWMDTYMKRTFTEVIENFIEGTVEYVDHVDEFITGACVATPDMKSIVSWVYNAWTNPQDLTYEELENYTYFYGYVLPVDPVSSIKAAQSDLAVNALRGGVIEIAGQAASLVVYDINGRQVFSAQAPASTVSTGLASGIYLVKATDASGNCVIAKAAF